MRKYKKELERGAVLVHSLAVPAAFPISTTLAPYGGGAGNVERIARAHVTHMNKQLDITGGKSLADIFTAYGKVVDKGRRKFTLSFDIISTLKLVAKGVQVNAQDKDKALACMSDSEKAAVARFNTLCAAYAQERNTGEMAERWTISGTVTLD